MVRGSLTSTGVYTYTFDIASVSIITCYNILIVQNVIIIIIIHR